LKKTSISLQQAFDSTFHHKLNFDDFLNLNVAHECEYISNEKINPSIKLKKYLKFLNGFVFNYAKVNTNVVHSYIRKKSPLTAVIPHVNSKFFFQTDIQNFFNSITKQDIEIILDTNLENVPINDIYQYKNQLLNIITLNDILPVGFPTSPNISNSFLFTFDDALEKYCKNNEIIYTRYCDDIILSTNNENSLDNIQYIISKYLSDFYNDRIKINLNKTKYTHKGNKIKLLGIVILPSGKTTVDIKVKKQLEVLIHFYVNDKEKFADYLKNHYHGGFDKISGQLNYINTFDDSYLDKLRKKYGNFIIDSFYHQSIK
jgi:RNA-directed DNA polymerase